MEALVTGCGGFIGGHLCQELLRRSWRVTGIDNLLPSYEVAPRRYTIEQLSQHPSFQFFEIDLADASLLDLLAGKSVVFHLAAKAGVRSSWEELDSYLRSNLLGMQRLLGAVAKTGGPKVVFASSSSVYGRAERFPSRETDELHPVSPYGVTKAAGEQLLAAFAAEHGVQGVALRYFTVYGPRQRSDMAIHKWIRAALEGTTITVFGDGSVVRDFTDVNDVVDATILGADLPGGTVANVAGGSPVDLNQLLDMIRSLTGRELTIQRIEEAKGDPKRTGGDTTRIQQLAGWSPAVPLEEGLAREISWMETYLKTGR